MTAWSEVWINFIRCVLLYFSFHFWGYQQKSGNIPPIIFVVCISNYIELNRHYTTQLTAVLQLVTSATCFDLILPSSALQRLVSIKVHNVAVPMGFNSSLKPVKHAPSTTTRG